MLQVCHVISHRSVLQEMHAIDAETTALLMSNISANLENPEFLEEYLQLLRPVQAAQGQGQQQ